MKTATLGQVEKLLGLLKEVSREQLQAVLGSGLLPDLLNTDVSRVDRVEFRKVCGLRMSVLFINRGQPFDPAKLFPNPVWSIDEQDNRSLALTQLDSAKVRLVDMLQTGETNIKAGEVLRRLKKAGHIRLDAGIFLAFWENQAFIPRSWKGKVVFFDGTVFRNLTDNRCYVLFLYCHNDGQWDWNVRCLVSDPPELHLSAVL